MTRTRSGATSCCGQGRTPESYCMFGLCRHVILMLACQTNIAHAATSLSMMLACVSEHPAVFSASPNPYDHQFIIIHLPMGWTWCKATLDDNHFRHYVALQCILKLLRKVGHTSKTWQHQLAGKSRVAAAGPSLHQSPTLAGIPIHHVGPLTIYFATADNHSKSLQ